MTHMAQTGFSANVHPIPRSSASGEIPPVVDLESYSPRIPFDGLPAALAEGGSFRQLVRCWAREESASEKLWAEIGERENQDRSLEPPADLFVLPGDAAFFSSVIGQELPVWHGRRFYAGTTAMKAIEAACHQNLLSLSDEDNVRRRVRADAIERADQHHTVAKLVQTEELGINELKHAIHWQSKNVSALRQIIIAHRANDLSDLLLKILVYMSCLGEPLHRVIEQTEYDLVELNKKHDTCDTVVRESIVLDLLHLLKTSGLTLDDLSGDGHQHVSAA